jgi:CheY-like chemotaxis protein
MQKILIVEDDPGLAEMLAHYFHVQGYEVASTALGLEACVIAGDVLPDVIVLDIHLPDINGYDVCQRLQDSHRTRGIPIIFLTELTDRLDKLQGLKLGGIDYITKPFDVQELRLRVRNTLYRVSTRATRNPVTQLPEGEPVFEALAGAGPECALLVTCLRGVNTFRELYGFVASDDVIRVTSLMIRNAAMEIGGAEAFCGHIDERTLLVLAPSAQLDALEARIQQRADQSLEYFYPSDNRGENARTRDRLRISMGRIMRIEEGITDLTALKEAISDIQ